MGKTVSYRRPDGQSIAGYPAEAAHAVGAPGVVVIRERCALSEQITGAAALAWRRTMALLATHRR